MRTLNSCIRKAIVLLTVLLSYFCFSTEIIFSGGVKCLPVALVKVFQVDADKRFILSNVFPDNIYNKSLQQRGGVFFRVYYNNDFSNLVEFGPFGFTHITAKKTRSEIPNMSQDALQKYLVTYLARCGVRLQESNTNLNLVWEYSQTGSRAALFLRRSVGQYEILLDADHAGDGIEMNVDFSGAGSVILDLKIIWHTFVGLTEKKATPTDPVPAFKKIADSYYPSADKLAIDAVDICYSFIPELTSEYFLPCWRIKVKGNFYYFRCDNLQELPKYRRILGINRK